MNTVHNQARKAKRQEQMGLFHTVQHLPQRAQADTLFSLWPFKLPKAVKKNISPSLRQAWRDLREEKIDRQADELEAFINEIMESSEDMMIRDMREMFCPFTPKISTFSPMVILIVVQGILLFLTVLSIKTEETMFELFNNNQHK